MEPKKISMMTLVEPVIRVNQFLGVFPMEIQGNIVVFRWNSFQLFKTMLNLVILTGYFCFLGFQYVRSMYAGEGIVGLVVLAIWQVKTLITILVLFIGICKRNQFTFFFQQCEANQCKLAGFVNCQLAVAYARRCYKLYILLTLVTAGFCAGQAYADPQEIYSIIYYVQEPTNEKILLNCFFQLYIHFVSQAAFSFIEVLCPTLARSIFGSITRIRDEMLKSVEKNAFPWTNKDLDLDTTISSNIFGNQIKSRNVKLSLYPTAAEEKDAELDEGIGPIMKALERFNLITNKLGLINCIFGPILALNTAWLVINVCLLLFLEIRYLNPASGKTADNLESRVDLYVLLLVICNCVTVTIRLLLVVLSLGKVFHASRCFDNCILNALMDIPKPHKQIDLLLIQLHLTKSGNSPVAFTAAGFFVFQRETILYVISIVTTYLVFLLQA